MSPGSNEEFTEVYVCLLEVYLSMSIGRVYLSLCLSVSSLLKNVYWKSLLSLGLLQGFT